MTRVFLRAGKERPVRLRHPWLFSGALGRIETEASDGDVVDVVSAGGEWLARGYLNRSSQITVRLLTWDTEEQIDRDFWRRRLQRAIAGRAALAADPQTTAYRLVHAESDGLPGLVVDRYGDWLVAQFLTLGIERQKEALVELLMELAEPQGIIERSDVAVRRKEGLERRSGLLAGDAPPPLVEVQEHGHRFAVDIVAGQKTGFYLDQRQNRQRVAAYAAGRETLNAFAYTGAFAVYALAAGARHVTNVESSYEALELAEHNLALNGFDPDQQAEQIAGNVFEVLRGFRDAGRQFDLAILDPPRFAETRGQVEAATRGYKDINLLALQLLRPGGILATFSCSGLVSEDLFQKVVFGASVDAGRDVQILERLSQPPDHPVLLAFPEGAYLKGFICRVW
ncbi:MAG: class I SAM-dependent methyltransferase [Chloroflexi bacterium]|nr:class I SAM-dependent methyltransferase [Chloroflexota bacterium]